MANDKQDRYAAGVVTIRRGEVFRVMVGDGDHGCYCVGTAEDESLAQIIAEGWLETVKRMKEKADD